IQDLYAQPVDGGQARLLDGAARGAIDGAEPVLDPQRVRMAFVRRGDVFVRDLRSGALLQLTRSEAQEADPRWGSDGSLVWRSGHDWFRWNAGDGVVVHAAAPKAEDDPARPPKADRMREDQLRLVATLRREREQREALRAQEEQWRRADPSRPPAPVYLGKDVESVATALSPDGRWLFAVTERKQAERGQPSRATRTPRRCAPAWAATCRGRSRSGSSTCSRARRARCRPRSCPASARTRWPHCAAKPVPSRSRGRGRCGSKPVSAGCCGAPT